MVMLEWWRWRPIALAQRLTCMIRLGHLQLLYSHDNPVLHLLRSLLNLITSFIICLTFLYSAGSWSAYKTSLQSSNTVPNTPRPTQ